MHVMLWRSRVGTLQRQVWNCYYLFPRRSGLRSIEVHALVLTKHTFFRLYNGVNPSGVRHICHNVISQVSLSRDAVLEVPVSLQICFIARGKLSYHQEVCVPLVGPMRTWDQKLTPGLMLLSFMTAHLFQFHFAVTEHPCQSADGSFVFQVELLSHEEGPRFAAADFLFC